MAGSLKKTPLFPVYEKYGAKTIDFGGWELPVQFISIIKEHQAVRNQAGLFDVSHMGDVEVKGSNALPYIQKLITNDVSKLEVNQALYSPMCYPDGGTVDDQLVYKLQDDHYLIVINAANIDKDVEWMQKHVEGDVAVEDISDKMAQLALQGPVAEKILQKLTDTDLSQIRVFRFLSDVELDGKKALVSRTGYTGEDGFEIYVKPEEAPILWDAILEAGAEEEIKPCGLGARDTLRFEARLPLYGQELSPDITPIEAGIGFAVKVNKDVDFIGNETLKHQKEYGSARKLVGIEMIERGIPRTDHPVYIGEEEIGQITTGTHSPTLKKNLGLALIQTDYTSLGTEVEVGIRNKRLKAKVVQTPFYKRR